MGKIARKLEIDFKSDNPNGIRVVYNASFPFKAYIIPRTCMSETSTVGPDEKIGVYFLFDEDRTKVYIGQTGNAIGRIQTHHQQKKFWSIAIMFLEDRDKWISLIDELETYCIIRLEKAYEAKKTRYIIQNTKKRGRKEDSLTRLSEIRDEIFPYIKFCLAAFEYNIESSVFLKKNSAPHEVPVSATRGGIKANGLYDSKTGKIIVLKNSEIRLDNPANSDNMEKTRRDYEKNGMIEKKRGKYILKEDVSFDKLSPAAEFVIGGSCNGKIEWKSNGKTLKEKFNL